MSRTHGYTIAAAVLGIALALPMTGHAQGMSEEQGKEILIELKHIEQLLEKIQSQGVRAAAPEAQPSNEIVKIDTRRGFALGKDSAPVTLVEFADYQCPYCRKFHITSFEKLKKDYIDTGKLRFVSRDLPLDMHSNAAGAALAARCAGAQGKYWDMRNVLIINADKLEAAVLPTYARDLGLDMDKFHSCMDSKNFAQDIQADVAEAQAAGISGTPVFVLGRTTKHAFKGTKLIGAQPYATFEEKIRELIGS